MLGKNSLKLTGVALAVMLLASCQQPLSAQNKATADTTHSAAQTSRPARPAEPAPATVITVHLAQERSEPSLVAVELGENQQLYALPQPVLTQADMKQVTPVTNQKGNTFIVFELTPNGQTKLANVSKQAKGHYFLISAKGQLIDVAQIDEPLTTGELVIATNNEQHSRQILQLLR